MFDNPNWLPAHKKCKIKCELGVEICQISSENTQIFKQRCLKRNFRNFFVAIKKNFFLVLTLGN